MATSRPSCTPSWSGSTPARSPETARKTSLIDDGQLRAAADLIRAGRLVAFPTETVYGLGANALDAAAVARIFEAKGRPSTSPLIVHVASIEQARELAADWPEAADRLARRFWPGPLTLVLPKRPCIPGIVTAGLETVGLRMPAHPVALALIRAAGVPIAAPSANRFTQVSPTTAARVREGLGPAVELVLDGGPTEVGIESTVLELAADGALLLRPGMIAREEIEALIGPVRVGGEAGPGSHPSPGMHRRHYSPKTPVVLVHQGEVPNTGRGVYIGFLREPAIRDTPFVEMPNEARAYASVLYETLHRLDREGWDWIAIEHPEEAAEWAAIADRLKRAAAR